MLRKTVFFIIFAACAFAKPVHLRCNYRDNPLGIDDTTPRLSWQSDNREQNWRQSGYQLLVASNSAALKEGKADIWDSQKVTSDESVGIVYAGPPLESRRRYYWSVRVWDSAGHPSPWGDAAWWEMGLLQASGWKAQWISRKDPAAESDRSGIHWIWTPSQDAHSIAPGTVAVFRTVFSLSEKPKDAALFLLAKGDWKARVNDSDAGSKTEWHSFDRRDITDHLIAGSNTIEVTVTVPPPPQFGPTAGPPNKPQPAALAALVKIIQPSGEVTRIPSGDAWQTHLENGTDWQTASLVVEDSTFATPGPLPQPAAALRRSFSLADKVTSARLYITALGAYSAFLNGKRIGSSFLTPGWTDFSKHLQYQVYDVTSLLKEGPNTLSALVGDGWFSSPLTWIGDAHFFGYGPNRLLGQLQIHYSDGREETVATSDDWKTSSSGVLNSEIYKGEDYDARFDPPGWKLPSFDDAAWPSATVSEAPAAQLVAQESSPITTTEILHPERVTSPSPGVYVFDMGQNMAGNAHLIAQGPAGTRVHLRFAEILNPDGNIYVKNLRNADATDIFVLRGTSGKETLSPEFSFQGFRYVEVTGYPGKPSLQDLSAEVITSLPEDPSANIVTPNETVNKMWTLGIWGQRSNFITIPTDCPQRDERLGWTGDAGVFWRTGSYNFNIAPFSHKWMRDMRDSQTLQGAFPNVSPDILPFFGSGAPGWGDAGVIVPWTTWLQYGDRQIITENWDAMEKWLAFIVKANPDFIRKNDVGADFADWLAPDPNTPKDLVDTAYWGLVAKMMAQMAHATGKEEEAKKYTAVFENVSAAFQKAYLKPDGTVGAGTQTGYVLALYVGLCPKSLEPALVSNLVSAIDKNGGHLSTGFLGTPFLLFALSDHGRADVAYRLLLNDSYPSWGYMIKKGATTWWERWNGDTGDPAMNSYNHYSFGSVVAWLYRSVGGIDTVPDAPGFHQIVIHPHPNENLPQARAEYESAYGKIVTEWNGTPSGPFSLKVTIPANTRARIFLPAISNASVTESGHAVQTQTEGDSSVAEVGSGSYFFKVAPTTR